MAVFGGLLRWLAPCVLLILAPAAAADSWALPEVRTYESPGKQLRLTVTPRALEDQLSFFEEAVEKKDRPGQAERGPTEPRGLLERRDASGLWVALWDAPLVNDVAPVSALVSDTGAYVATFDNWHSMGWGKDAVAIYDATGRLVRAMALQDFLPKDWFLTLPRSVSSIHWSGEHRFEQDRLILQVAMPGADARTKQTWVELALDPATGKAEPLDPGKWQRAIGIAAREAVPVRAAHAEHLAMLRAPLRMPDGVSDKRTLHWYLVEAFQRLDAEWEGGFPETDVLPRPKDKSYRESLEFVGLWLDPEGIGTARAIASHDPANLASVLLAEAAKRAPGSLAGVRVYATIGDTDRAAVAAALERLGAVFIQLDPAKPIPQRAERIPGPDDEL